MKPRAAISSASCNAASKRLPGASSVNVIATWSASSCVLGRGDLGGRHGDRRHEEEAVRRSQQFDIGAGVGVELVLGREHGARPAAPAATPRGPEPASKDVGVPPDPATTPTTNGSST